MRHTLLKSTLLFLSALLALNACSRGNPVSPTKGKIQASSNSYLPTNYNEISVIPKDPDTVVTKDLAPPPFSFACMITGGAPASVFADPYGNAIGNTPSAPVTVLLSVKGTTTNAYIGIHRDDMVGIQAFNKTVPANGKLSLPLSFLEPGDRHVRFIAFDGKITQYCDLEIEVRGQVPNHLTRTLELIYQDPGDGRDFFFGNGNEIAQAKAGSAVLKYYDKIMRVFTQPVGECNLPLGRFYNGKAHTAAINPPPGFKLEWVLGFVCPGPSPDLFPVLTAHQAGYTYTDLLEWRMQQAFFKFGWTPEVNQGFALPPQ